MEKVFIKRNPFRLLCERGNEVSVADYLTGAIPLAKTTTQDGWTALPKDEEFYRSVYEEAVDLKLLPNIVIDPNCTYEQRLVTILKRNVVVQGHFVVCTSDLSFYCTKCNEVTGVLNVVRGEAKPHWFTTSVQANLASQIMQKECPTTHPVRWVVMSLSEFTRELCGVFGAPEEAITGHSCHSCRGCMSNCDAAY